MLFMKKNYFERFGFDIDTMNLYLSSSDGTLGRALWSQFGNHGDR